MSILFPYFELAASLFILLLCFRIYTRHYENKAARFFAFFAFVAFLAAIFEYSIRIAFTLDLARNLDRIAGPLWTFLFAIFAHFCFIFTKKKKFLENPLSLIFLYLPPSLLSLLFIFTNLMYTRYEIWSIGIVSQPAPLYWLFLANTAVYALLGIIILYSFAVTTPQKTERIQAIFIITGSVIPLLVGIVFDGILPTVLGIRKFVPTVVFGIALMNLFIYIAMRRYSLFSISPALAADTIMEAMPDSLLVTDLAGRIIFLNEGAKKFFHVPESQVAGHHIKDLFRQKEEFYQLYSAVVKQNQIVERFRAELTTPLGEQINALINARLLQEKAFKERIGIVFIIRDIRG